MAGKKILIVDDEKWNRDLLVELFEKQEYEVFSASNGEEGLDQIIKIHPDVVLLDVMMPIMDGFEVLTALQQDESVKDIPVIMLTSLGMEEDISKGKALGAVEYLTKPVQSVTVTECVQRVLNSD